MSKKSIQDIVDEMKAKEEKPVDVTLHEREARYGDFSSHATISIALKTVVDMHGYKLNNSQREALHMICHKIGRILNGDPNYADSWHDIAGYARLVELELNERP